MKRSSGLFRRALGPVTDVLRREAQGQEEGAVWPQRQHLEPCGQRPQPSITAATAARGGEEQVPESPEGATPQTLWILGLLASRL